VAGGGKCFKTLPSQPDSYAERAASRRSVPRTDCRKNVKPIWRTLTSATTITSQRKNYELSNSDLFGTLLLRTEQVSHARARFDQRAIFLIQLLAEMADMDVDGTIER